MDYLNRCWCIRP